MKAEEINIRDPYILVHEGRYYMYGTRGETAFSEEADGFDVYISTDLLNFEGPYEVFHRPKDFFSRKNFWAPEVHVYDNRFYMFASFANEQEGLGTCILAADSPMGPFSPWSEGYVTPHNWRCLDGTLYVSKEGTPYMVFSHEWVQIQDGTICAMELSKDLKQAVGEPFVLFAASEAKPFVKDVGGGNYVTDGPFLIRTEDDMLHMLWSTFGETGYVEAMAHADTNEIGGKWTVDETLLYHEDGGHGMIFRDLQGQYQMVLHSPNTAFHEHPVWIPLDYEGGFRVK